MQTFIHVYLAYSSTLEVRDPFLDFPPLVFDNLSLRSWCLLWRYRFGEALAQCDSIALFGCPRRSSLWILILVGFVATGRFPYPFGWFLYPKLMGLCRSCWGSQWLYLCHFLACLVRGWKLRFSTLGFFWWDFWSFEVRALLLVPRATLGWNLGLYGLPKWV